MASGLKGMERKRLRLLLGVFFLALSLPTAILVRQAFVQLKWESFQQHRVLAEELAARIDKSLQALIDTEEARSFSDYGFLVVAGDPTANFVQRSPLSEFPIKSNLPGLVGYFQVDAQGIFTSPLLPTQKEHAAAYGIGGQELNQRLAAQTHILDILSRNRLVRDYNEDLPRAPSPARPSTVAALKPLESGAELDEESMPLSAQRKDAAPAPPPKQKIQSQAAFDQLSGAAAESKKAAGRLTDKNADGEDAENPVQSLAKSVVGKLGSLESRGVRKERSALPEPQSLKEETTLPQTLAPKPIRVTTFESEIDPFEFSRLDSGHFVLFRKVWRDGQRYIQGLLIESEPFLRNLIEVEFRQTALSNMSGLAVAYQGGILRNLSGLAGQEYLPNGGEWRGDLLYRTRFSAPLSELELIFTIDRLPPGPGGIVVGWLGGILALVLCGGFLLMYRLGLRQLDLARQQQDFISAVSHELKTPLTSIRMYGEMLREGWVPEEKKAQYYEFIQNESERLSRLINNVLQLARMSRNRLSLKLKTVTVAELLDGLRSKIATQVERNGFQLTIQCETETGQARLLVDEDSFVQIIINLVDNALKFSAKSDKLTIDISCQARRDQTLVFSVRDYGPGIPKNQMKKIFGLFYRLENELTRETVGTGIGLALVYQLALAMKGGVELVNRSPGAEFRVIFKSIK